VVSALDSRLDGRGFNSRPPRPILGWVTVFGRANHFSITLSNPCKLSLLPSEGWEMSTSQSAATVYGCGLKACRYGSFRAGGRQICVIPH